MNNKVYIHDKNLAYPNKEFVHMIKSEKYHDYTYDANFPYRLRGFKCLFIRFWIKVAMIILVKPICAIRYALKIKGKKNIKEYFIAQIGLTRIIIATFIQKRMNKHLKPRRR